MVLTPRFIAKSASAAQASKSPTLPRPVAKATFSPRILHSGAVPAQLCFNFKRG